MAISHLPSLFSAIYFIRNAYEPRIQAFVTAEVDTIRKRLCHEVKRLKSMDLLPRDGREHELGFYYRAVETSVIKEVILVRPALRSENGGAAWGGSFRG